LEDSPYEMIQAHRLADANLSLGHERPRAIILDVLLGRANTWEFLADLKADEATRDIPVILVTVVDNERKALGMGADAFGIKPVGKTWLLETLQRLAPVEVQGEDSPGAHSPDVNSKGADSAAVESPAVESPAVNSPDAQMPQGDGHD
ncbi:MAG: hypothetical protein LC772_03995, partial [Chloroflexi bacterium]|nr:hypothetical protein [Chloroflexota bacterium]